MLNFLLVRIYFCWPVFYTDTSGNFSSAGAGWLCPAGLKLEKGAWWGVWERSHTRNPTAAQNWVYFRFRDNSTLMKSPARGERVCMSMSLPHTSVLRVDFVLDEGKYQKAEYLTPIFFKTSWMRSYKLAFWSHDTDYCRAQHNGASSSFYTVRHKLKISLN